MTTVLLISLLVSCFLLIFIFLKRNSGKPWLNRLKVKSLVNLAILNTTFMILGYKLRKLF